MPLQYVCGDDGKTYFCQSYVNYKNCRDKTSIRVVHSGTCGSVPNQSNTSQMTGKPTTNQPSSTAKPVINYCAQNCSDKPGFYCDSKGGKYGSQCALHRVLCIVQKIPFSSLKEVPCIPAEWSKWIKIPLDIAKEVGSNFIKIPVNLANVILPIIG
ncbi:agrin-like [Lingula anatina]|uniref:Agrin-like n=1 Tax=Lingula anatina TaxID=7574 RepID=A0A1S3I740_LINAN|nr:agrin-like [Lingula anatina]|eukprot:XP_013393666.1 agrin-like [Lingula anatina]